MPATVALASDHNWAGAGIDATAAIAVDAQSVARALRGARPQTVAIRVTATVAVTAAIAASTAQVRNRRENLVTVPPLESSSD